MEPTLEEAKSLVKNVDGWLDDSEGELLYDLAKQCHGRGVIVEIGSWKGKSTIWLASGSRAGKGTKVYAIDPHTGSPEHTEAYGDVWTFDAFRRNIREAGVEDVVVPIIKTSHDAAASFDHPVELIFIDGAHEYEAVKQDFELWFPKVIEGGTIAFHDVAPNWPGPVQVVRESLYKSRQFRGIRLVASITYAQKVSRNSVGEWLRNSSLAWTKEAIEAARGMDLPKPVKSLGRRVANRLDSRLFSLVR